MAAQSERLAWLGYKNGALVAIELEGFHAGETVAEWESRGYRVEQVTNAEAKRRWRAEVQNGWDGSRQGGVEAGYDKP